MKKVAAGNSFITVCLCLTAVTASAQQAPVNLRSDASFALLGGTTVTVTGGGTITGNIGIYPGTAYVPGTPPVTVNGTVYAGGPIAAQAQADLSTAYNDAAGRSVAPISVSGNIGGLTLAPGLYKSTSSLAISSGNLTLDAQGNTNAVWIFQIASTLTTTSGRQVILANGANPANIFWQVGTSATIGTTSVFQGNILAAVSISMLTGSTLSGRALAMGGAVTVDTGGGSSATVPVAPTAPTVTSTVPANGATGVVATSKLTATFSTAMNPGTINGSTFTLAQAGAPVSGVVTYVGTTATFTPTSALIPSTLYTATVTTGATDTAGNALAANYVWTFTTGAASPTPPAVISTTPPSGATGVAVGSKLSAAFSESMDPATITSATFTLMQSGVAVPGAVSFVGTTATFAPSSNLVPGGAYTATITTGAKDLSGLSLPANYVWSFVAGSSADTTPPTVSFTVPVNNAQSVTVGSAITVTFTEAMDPATINTNTFTLQKGATGVPGTVTYAPNTATFTPTTPLAFNTVYTGTITNGAKDLAGNALATNFVWNFTTAAVLLPNPVISVSGTVNDASYTAPVVPVSIAAVFGANLAIGQGAATAPTPLPGTLAQSIVTIGGLTAPLYFAIPTQVSFQVPWELAGQGSALISANVNGAVSNTQTVPLAPFAPGIFTIDASGSGQGAIEIAPTAQLAAAATPVQRGGYVAIFCTGLGAVDNQPATGAAALAVPLSRTLTLPIVTIGGVGAVVSYSGLAPGFAGLYQVNAIVPAGISTGPAVTVAITIGGVTSNTVTIGVQ
ncbi:MAG: Ig-like domain-containing protein [Acidobacteriota bacterium]|nr:Ig-like domain-containing protein [Acidobacteriota bacterium]